MLIVQKFGGSSVADAGKIVRAADLIADAYNAGSQVVAVLSAQGDCTDALMEKAREITPRPGRRELDALLSVGEQISIALMALELERRGLPAVSLTGWQAGLYTDSSHGAARIRRIDTGRIRRELAEGRIVLAAGFQGVDSLGDVTTLGRGGSDTTAAALAAALEADRCQIFTDVDGIYTADPRRVPEAEKLEAISCEEMLELAAAGSQVLHSRAVEMAMGHGVELEVLSSAAAGPGTTVKAAAPELEGRHLSGITQDTDCALVTAAGVPGAPGAALRLLGALAAASVQVKLIQQTPAGSDAYDFRFLVPGGDTEAAKTALEGLNPAACGIISVSGPIAAVSLVGAGLMDSPDPVQKLLEALAEEHIPAEILASGEIRLTAAVPRPEAARAVTAIHRKLFQKDGV